MSGQLGFKTFDSFDFFKDAVLQTIQIAQYQIQFKFDTGAYISVTSEAHHYDADTGKTNVFDANGTRKEIFSAQTVLGHKVTDVQVASDDELMLTFDNGDALTFVRRHNGYESMTIGGGVNGPKGLIVLYADPDK